MTSGARRIRIERSGGVAGLALRAEVVDQRDVNRLLDALATAPPRPGPSSVRDGFSYRFEVDAEQESGAAPAVYDRAEHELPRPIRELVARVLRGGNIR
ncbi:MAG: Emfourin [Microbacteriaceae bacterium]|jgi:hypothetical protein|nr:Emfourin [Microbacteriaceae bacterium]